MNLSKPKQIFGIDISYDLDRSVTMIDKTIMGDKAVKFNVDGPPADAKPEADKKAEAETQSWIKRNANKIGDFFQQTLKGKSKYSDQRTEIQREIDRLGGIWTDKRPMNNGLSNYELLLASASRGGSIHGYLRRNNKYTYVTPLLNVVQAYRLGADKPGYELIPGNVLNVAMAFIRWAKLVYGNDVVEKENLAPIDERFIKAFKAQSTPEQKKEVEKVVDSNKQDNKGAGDIQFGKVILWTVVILAAVYIINKMF